MTTIIRGKSMDDYENIPRYNEDSICPKCEFTKVARKYLPIDLWNTLMIGDREPQPPIQLAPERMLRTCCNCQYWWFEKPLDVEVANDVTS